MQSKFIEFTRPKNSLSINNILKVLNNTIITELNMHPNHSFFCFIFNFEFHISVDWLNNITTLNRKLHVNFPFNIGKPKNKSKLLNLIKVEGI